jgi:hypothetical protein
MTQVDIGLTNVSRFDLADPAISDNDAINKTWGVTSSPKPSKQWFVYFVVRG